MYSSEMFSLKKFGQMERKTGKDGEKRAVGKKPEGYSMHHINEMKIENHIH